jgi:hypothetical protein
MVSRDAAAFGAPRWVRATVCESGERATRLPPKFGMCVCASEVPPGSRSLYARIALARELSRSIERADLPALSGDVLLLRNR